jgi:hypothetical protein
MSAARLASRMFCLLAVCAAFGMPQPGQAAEKTHTNRISIGFRLLLSVEP